MKVKYKIQNAKHMLTYNFISSRVNLYAFTQNMYITILPQNK